MINTIESREIVLLENLRQQYESQGYQFLVEPKAADIPTFLEGYIPDAIAIGADERVIIEVKSSELSAKKSATVKFLAAEVPKHKGWRFDLVVAGKGQGNGDIESEPDKQQLQLEIEHAKRLSRSGDLNVALVLAWALLEAVTRRLILNKNSGESKRYLPRTIVETLTSEGFIRDDSVERLLKLADIRNRLVHGFSNLKVDRADVDFLLKFLDGIMLKVK